MSNHELYKKVSLKCSKLCTNSYSTSFSMGINFLDKSIHDEIYAIYGFVRFADEIVDSFHDHNKKELLDEFQKDTWQAIKDQISLNPILESFQWVVNKYKIDHSLIQSFFDSMAMDLENIDYTKELYTKYILGSAEVVGLMCLRVFIYGSDVLYEKLKAPAMSLGAAFQKVNFLRDLQEDTTKLKRNYFPQLQNQTLNQEIKKDLIIEIKKDFNDAYAGIKELPPNSQLGVYVAYTYYKKLLEKIERSSPLEILQRRIRISNLKKIFLATKAWCGLKTKLVKLSTVLVLILLCTLPIQAQNINNIRNLYRSCDKSKLDYQNFSTAVNNTTTESRVLEAYKAVDRMLEAKFTLNPLNKIKFFIEGKNQLENLIKANPNNAEMRFIRISTQIELPFFLSYKDNIVEDKVFLNNYLKNTDSQGNFEKLLDEFLQKKGLNK
jgi:phytoene synthase